MNDPKKSHLICSRMCKGEVVSRPFFDEPCDPSRLPWSEMVMFRKRQNVVEHKRDVVICWTSTSPFGPRL